MNKEVRKVLLKLGITSNLQGYHYIIEAFKIIQKQKIHTNITTIYAMVGKKLDNTPTGVERGIRHALQKSWKTETLKKIYTKMPDNSVFLYDLYFNFDIMKDEIKK